MTRTAVATLAIAALAVAGAGLALGACSSSPPSADPGIPGRIGTFPLDTRVTVFHAEVEPFRPTVTAGLPVVRVQFTVTGRPYGTFVCVGVALRHGTVVGRTPLLGYPATGAPPVDESIVVHLSQRDFDAGVTGARVACADEIRPPPTTAAPSG